MDIKLELKKLFKKEEFVNFEVDDDKIVRDEGIFKILDITGQTKDKINKMLETITFPIQISVISANYVDTGKSKKIEYELMNKYEKDKFMIKEIEEFMNWFRSSLMFSLIPKKLFYISVGVKKSNGKNDEIVLNKILNERVETLKEILDKSYVRILKRSEITFLINSYSEESIYMHNKFVSIFQLFEYFIKNKEDFYVPKTKTQSR